MPTIEERARNLADQHESGDLVILPTAWDTWSARVAADAGFTGLTIGSHPVADAIGSADGEQMDFDEYLGVIERIVRSVDVPVSADVESGYGLPGGDLINRLIEVGAVGANIEDVVHREGRRVRDRAEHAEYIAAAREAAVSAGIPFVINGRTDAMKLGDVFEDPLEEAAERMRLMEQAGARSVYPVGLRTADEVRQLVGAVSVPVNVTAHPVEMHGAGDVATLRELGARRVSFGPKWQAWLGEVSAKQFENWTAEI
ncbi:isocitrate lyase/phosphoenolpyruvate mutase family protein [Flaviflexus salsibiostraticola]|uniref:Isocitrate lyase/phosphoenolpyruvate mutase family protein n=1 Tax=Flaviflexus salsibiostraticola TaxID=1282737 RepID=A0A3Q8WUN9_9ACTO|nr:isocitrate lyase/phosphoenolpyruvate mutase family protein [Flaviflexus salsibiostraticola]AZN30737.1 isocitrate lyase/phosphoenolpyruvate mutase family protein [Flaviflexus salsibiostraticola]